MKQRNIEVGCDQQGESDGFQIAPMLFLMRINPGIKIGGIVHHGGQVHLKFCDQMLRQGALHLPDPIRREVAHMVPKPLTAQIGLPHRKVTVKGGAAKPFAQWRFATWR